MRFFWITDRYGVGDYIERKHYKVDCIKWYICIADNTDRNIVIYSVLKTMFVKKLYVHVIKTEILKNVHIISIFVQIVLFLSVRI
jgi:hypothetical protein